MSEINVVSTTQRIVVDPFSSAVAVINAGPMGPAGPTGSTGPPGPGDPNEYVRWATFTLNDDQACYIAFPVAVIQTSIWIAPNTAVGCGALVVFRCGDASAFASGLALSGTLATGVGALTTGTTDGTDGSLNIFAQNATAPRLYIKNRTAATRSYRYALLSGQPGAAPVLL